MVIFILQVVEAVHQLKELMLQVLMLMLVIHMVEQEELV